MSIEMNNRTSKDISLDDNETVKLNYTRIYSGTRVLSFYK